MAVPRRIEIELLAAGLLERVRDGSGRETVRVTDRGVVLLARTLASNRAATRRARGAGRSRGARHAARRPHRLAGPGLHAKVGDAWRVAMPDVYSIRHTTVEHGLEPVVHEIKVRRADLLADLRHAAKGAAYRELSSQCWYVLRAGIAQPQEIPEAYGVILAHEGALEIARPAPRRALRPPFHLWMALARAAPLPVDDNPQCWLGDADAQSAPCNGP